MSLDDFGQEELVKYIKSAGADGIAISSQLETFDLASVFAIYKNAVAPKPNINNTEIAPIPFPRSILTADTDEKQARYRSIGESKISEHAVAVVTLAGGQGSRLGFSGPKGIYDIGLNLKMSLFELQAKKIKFLSEKGGAIITWLVMTSPLNHEATESFFVSNNFFGLNPSNVFLFQQGVLPCFDFDDKLLLKTKSTLATSPDGNGGVYLSLENAGMIEELSKRNVKYVHFISIDNALVVPSDPLLIGAAASFPHFELGNVTIRRTQWDEKIGTFAFKNNVFQCIEYSEIPEELAKEKASDGNLKHRAGNICNHILSLDFIKAKVLESPKGLKSLYHVAKKKIPSYDFVQSKEVIPEQNNGIKLELFIFDVFQLSDQDNLFCLEMPREECFAPVKNAPGSPSDTPEVARDMFRNLCKQWLTSSAIPCQGTGYVEISPSLGSSVDLQWLYELLKAADKALQLPCVLLKGQEKNAFENLTAVDRLEHTDKQLEHLLSGKTNIYCLC